MQPPRIPSLNWLRVFEMAARKRSFARAAEALAMSPPAVSQQIRALEGYLGRALFERGARSVRLTEAGEAFLPAVAQALASVEMTAQGLFGRADAEPLTIRASLMWAASWLAPRLPEFEAAHPAVQLTLLTGDTAEEFARPGADLAVSFGLTAPAGHEADILFGERLYPVAVPRLAAAIGRPEALAGHTLYEVATHRSNWFRLLPEGVRPRFAFTDTTLIAFALAATGAGVALARSPASDGIERQFGLVPCLPGHEARGDQRYQLTYPARTRLSPAARAFRDWLLEGGGAGGSGV